MTPALRALLFGAPNPVVDLRFAGGVYQIGGATYSSPLSIPGFTYTGGVAGAYAPNSAGLLIPFAVNVPPITDLGYFGQEARTNVILRSQEFDNASWTRNGTPTVTANAATAPDGTATADTVAVTSSGDGVFQAVTVANATAYAWSVYVKRISGSGIVLVGNEASPAARLSFDPGTGVITSPGVGLSSYGAAAMADSWWRVWGVYTTSATTSNITLYVQAPQTVAFWGAQLEAGSVATNYIETAGTAVTRAQDNAVITGLVLPNAGTLIVEAQTYDATSVLSNGGINPSVVCLANTTPGTEIVQIVRQATTNNAIASIRSAGSEIASLSPATWANGAVRRMATRYATDDYAASIAGSAVATDTSGAQPTGMTRIHIGQGRTVGTGQWNYAIRRIQVFDRLLSNAELQAASA